MTNQEERDLYISWIRADAENLLTEIERQTSGSELDMSFDYAKDLIDHIRIMQRYAEHL